MISDDDGISSVKSHGCNRRRWVREHPVLYSVTETNILLDGILDNNVLRVGMEHRK